MRAGIPVALLEDLGREYGARVAAVSGPPAEVLVTEAHSLGADLLVIGTVGMNHAPTDLLIMKTAT